VLAGCLPDATFDPDGGMDVAEAIRSLIGEVVLRLGPTREPSEMPGFIPPQLASLRTKPPSGEHWLHVVRSLASRTLDFQPEKAAVDGLVDGT
jgi:hypothetical protein